MLQTSKVKQVVVFGLAKILHVVKMLHCLAHHFVVFAARPKKPMQRAHQFLFGGLREWLVFQRAKLSSSGAFRVKVDIAIRLNAPYQGTSLLSTAGAELSALQLGAEILLRFFVLCNKTVDMQPFLVLLFQTCSFEVLGIVKAELREKLAIEVCRDVFLGRWPWDAADGTFKAMPFAYQRLHLTITSQVLARPDTFHTSS